MIQVIVGGTRTSDDWFPRSRPETTQDILARAIALCPELSPPEIRAIRTPTLDDIMPHIVGEGCGLRPARKGGFRLELEWVEGASVRREGRIPVVHNYGCVLLLWTPNQHSNMSRHGGYGYQISWGSANKVLELVDDALGTLKNS